MCYMLLLSTDLNVNLSEHNDALISFTQELPGLPEEVLIEHHYKWFVGSAHGCSCGFRHLYITSVVLGFGEPEDWFKEEPDDIKATLKFIEIIRELVESGAQVDCIDAWASDEKNLNHAGTVEINLNSIKNEEFRFFESHRFVFTTEPNLSSSGTPNGPLHSNVSDSFGV